MVKTITIKDEVYKRLSLQKGKDESFSDLFERLLDDHVSGIDMLRKLRGSVDFKKGEKEDITKEISSKRSERRF